MSAAVVSTAVHGERVCRSSAQHHREWVIKRKTEIAAEERRKEAEQIAKKLKGKAFMLLRQASDRGYLYGSVSPRDLAVLVTEKGFSVSRAQIALHTPIKAIGLHKVPVLLHPEVEVTVSVAVGRNADEARRIARGEEITLVREEGEETPAEAEAAAAAAEAFLEPQAKARRDRDGAADIGEAGAAPTPQEKKA